MAIPQEFMKDAKEAGMSTSEQVTWLRKNGYSQDEIAQVYGTTDEKVIGKPSPAAQAVEWDIKNPIKAGALKVARGIGSPLAAMGGAIAGAAPVAALMTNPAGASFGAMISALGTQEAAATSAYLASESLIDYAAQLMDRQPPMSLPEVWAKHKTRLEESIKGGAMGAATLGIIGAGGALVRGARARQIGEGIAVAQPLTNKQRMLGPAAQEGFGPLPFESSPRGLARMGVLGANKIPTGGAGVAVGVEKSLQNLLRFRQELAGKLAGNEVAQDAYEKLGFGILQLTEDALKRKVGFKSELLQAEADKLLKTLGTGETVMSLNQRAGDFIKARKKLVDSVAGEMYESPVRATLKNPEELSVNNLVESAKSAAEFLQLPQTKTAGGKALKAAKGLETLEDGTQQVEWGGRTFGEESPVGRAIMDAIGLEGAPKGVSYDQFKATKKELNRLWRETKNPSERRALAIMKEGLEGDIKAIDAKNPGFGEALTNADITWASKEKLFSDPRIRRTIMEGQGYKALSGVIKQGLSANDEQVIGQLRRVMGAEAKDEFGHWATGEKAFNKMVDQYLVDNIVAPGAKEWQPQKLLDTLTTRGAGGTLNIKPAARELFKGREEVLGNIIDIGRNGFDIKNRKYVRETLDVFKDVLTKAPENVMSVIKPHAVDQAKTLMNLIGGNEELATKIPRAFLENELLKLTPYNLPDPQAWAKAIDRYGEGVIKTILGPEVTSRLTSVSEAMARMDMASKMGRGSMENQSVWMYFQTTAILGDAANIATLGGATGGAIPPGLITGISGGLNIWGRWYSNPERLLKITRALKTPVYSPKAQELLRDLTLTYQQSIKEAVEDGKVQGERTNSAPARGVSTQ